EDAAALLGALERAQDAVRAAADAASAAREADDALEAWSGRAAGVLVRAGWGEPSGGVGSAIAGGPSPAGPDSPVGEATVPVPGFHAATAPPAPVHHDAILLAVTDAHAAAQSAVARAARRAALQERDAEDAAEADRLASRATSREADRDAVLAATGAADLSALEQARVETDRREALDASVREGDEAVRAEAGGGPDGDALITEARTGAVSDWAARREELDVELPRVDEERTAAIAARTDSTRDREALEASVDLPRIDGEIEQVRADAARLLTELRTTVRARELIGRTLDAFVRDRQPTVLRDASAWFARITDGRYTDVRQTLQERRGKQTPVLQVLTAHGAALDPATLSRGTREQLYLALRLALVGRTARDATPLPLVMDDVLVNFSPDRSRAVAEVVAEVAREHQVLFFTCHPATRDLLVDAAGGDGVRVEELTRG
ncbi:ATP-binding protein, partial [Patulibacter sp.]|uniref:ATP-binding protein n=1 Tax=Patulibacter sp. TaxID=1912859 RepID=UPI00271FD26B